MMKSFSQHAYDRDHELALMEDFMREGVNDPGIFKAFFTAGGPGSGKSYVAGRVGAGKVSPYGLKIVNSDNQYEKLLKDAGMAMNPENIFSPKGQEIRGRAKALTKRQQAGFIQGRLGLLIDGTGKDYAKIKKMSDSLKNIGYDTYMMFVNTSLDTAQQRNQMRERKLDKDEVAEMWKAVQSNMGKFQRYFGREQFILIDNNNATEKIFDKVYVEIGKLINKKPSSRAAHAWIKSQRP
jgi:predicted kinase